MKAVIGFGEIKELIKSEKGIKIIFAAGLILILVIAFSGLFTGRSAKNNEKERGTVESFADYESGLEQRLTEILSEIEGVGNVKVMITLDKTEQTEYGRNSDMLISVTAPEVRGVIVVCDGGDSVNVKEKVTDAVSGIFGINTLHISVTR